MTYFTKGQHAVKAVLGKEFRDSARPMREIPLYDCGMRCSCQQVICMPVREWDAMLSATAYYQPTNVDGDIVEKLAIRIAQALNAPLQTGDDQGWTPSYPVAWDTDSRKLLDSTNCHGMDDRLFDEYLRPIKRGPDQTASWRFNGFCGQLRVTGIGDEPWYVTVLAPTHFVGTLVDLARKCGD